MWLLSILQSFIQTNGQCQNWDRKYAFIKSFLWVTSTYEKSLDSGWVFLTVLALVQ